MGCPAGNTTTSPAYGLYSITCLVSLLRNNIREKTDLLNFYKLQNFKTQSSCWNQEDLTGPCMRRIKELETNTELENISLEEKMISEQIDKAFSSEIPLTEK